MSWTGHAIGDRMERIVVGPWGNAVVALLWVRRVLAAAYVALGSATCSELAEIAILCLLGMSASLLVLTPGDQTLGGIVALCQMLFQCD